MASTAHDFKLRSQVLVRETSSGDQLVIPVSRREAILKALHADATGGHLGKEKLVGKLRERYYWYGMLTDAEKYCDDCVDCQRRKAANPLPVAPMEPIGVENAFDLVSMDICGPYPNSNDGNKYVLVITEYLTKWVECYAMANQEAVTVAQKFEDYLARHGTPRSLLTDQGRNFESALLQEICRRYGIEKRSTSPYHPQCNGQTERFNRTMNEMLSQYVSQNEKDWDIWLPSVLFAYRSAVHASTGKTPFEMLYGRRPRLPIECEIPCFDAALTKGTPKRYVSLVKSTIESLHDQAQRNLRRSQARQKEQHDAGVNATPLRAGERVLLHSPQLKRGRSKKFHRPWRGPFVVLQSPRPPGVTYSIREEATSKVFYAHRNRLKRLTGSLTDPTAAESVSVDWQPVPAGDGQEGPPMENEVLDVQYAGLPGPIPADADVDVLVGDAENRSTVKTYGLQPSGARGDERIGQAEGAAAQATDADSLRRGNRVRRAPRRFGDEQTDRMGSRYE